MEKELSFSFGRNIRESWHLYKKNFLALVLVNIIFIAIMFVINLLQNHEATTSPVEMFRLNDFSPLPSIISLIVFPFISSFILKFSLGIVGKENVKLFSREIKTLLPSFKVYLNFLVALIIYSIIVGLGFVLLVIPGLYLLGRLFPVFYLIVDKKMGAIKAIKKSWQITKKMGWSLLGKQIQVIFFSAIPMFIVWVLIIVLTFVFAQAFLLMGLFLIPAITVIAYIVSALLSAPIGMIFLTKLYKEITKEEEIIEPAVEEPKISSGEQSFV